MNHRLLTALLIVLLLSVAVGVAGSAAAPEPLSSEWEPNDTFYEANWLPSDTRQHGRISPADDVDTYRIDVYGPTTLKIDIRLPESSPLTPVFALYDRTEALLAEVECPREGRCLTYETGEGYNSFYLVVRDGHGHAGLTYEYSLMVATIEVAGDPYEPNDFMSEATPYTLGEEISARLDPQGDIDTFVFTLAHQHDLALSSSADGATLLDANGEMVDSVGHSWEDMTLTVPGPGVYYLQLVGETGPYTFRLRASQRPVYVSFSGAGRLGGVAFAPGDVLRYTPIDGQWQMAFRAADHGLRGNLVAFSHGSMTGDLYMTFALSQNVPGLGHIGPSDVLRYTPANPEWGVDARWQRVVTGAAIGLTTGAERIDALDVDEGYYEGEADYYLSTTGRARLPYGPGQLLIANNDVVNYRTTLLDDGTVVGSFNGVLSGGDNGFGAANLTGLDYGDGWLVTFNRRVQLGGLTFAPGDVAQCTYNGWEGPPCMTVQRAFNAAAAGAGKYKIDAIDVGPRETPE